MKRTKVSPRVIERINARRSAIAKDLRSPKYRPRVVEDKRRKLGRGKLYVRDLEGVWRDAADVQSFEIKPSFDEGINDD